MVCKLAKKGLVGVGLGAGLLALLFGTAAPSYFRTAVHKIRHSAADSVPIQFQIERAKQEVAELEPAIHKNIEEIVRSEVEVDHLMKEIATTHENLEQEKVVLRTLRDRLDTGDFKLTSGATVSPERIKSELARRLDHYKTVKGILEDKQKTLDLRKQSLAAAREQNAKMREAKKELLTQIERIETHLKQIEATQAANEFNFDDSALARAKQTVTDLEKRVEVIARVAEQEGRYSDPDVSFDLEGRDVIREVDAELSGGQASPTTTVPTAGRSL